MLGDFIMCITLDNRATKFAKNSIKNDELRSFANMLAQDAMNIRANLLHMSAIMATIASKRDVGILDEFDGSIAKFGEERLGLKKSQVYNMVQVGVTFLDKDGNSLLPQKGGKWSNTQFMALLPMGGKKKNADDTLKACAQLIEDGKIKPSMTVAEIKEVVAVERPDAKEKEEKKKKIEEKKQQEETAKKRVDEKLHGKMIMNIEIWQRHNNTMYVKFNGERYSFDDSNIDEIVAFLKNADNYKK